MKKNFRMILLCMITFLIALGSFSVFHAEKSIYKVDFVGYNEELIDSQTVTTVDEIEYPDAPSVENMVFDKWSIEKEDIVLEDDDLTIEAIYKEPEPGVDKEITVHVTAPDIDFSQDITGYISTNTETTVKDFILNNSDLEIGKLLTEGYYLTAISDGDSVITESQDTYVAVSDRVAVRYIYQLNGQIKYSTISVYEYGYELKENDLEMDNSASFLNYLQPGDMSCFYAFGDWKYNEDPISTGYKLTPERNYIELYNDMKETDEFTYDNQQTGLKFKVDTNYNMTIYSFAENNSDSSYQKYYNFTTNLLIEEGIEELQDKCFINFYNLKTFSLPNSLKKIGKNVFYSQYITSITLPENLEEIYNTSFSSNYSINLSYCTEVNILSKNLKLIVDDTQTQKSLFCNLSTSVDGEANIYINMETVPAGLFHFDSSSYNGHVENLTFGNDVKKINDFAFCNSISCYYYDWYFRDDTKLMPQCYEIWQREKNEKGEYYSKINLESIESYNTTPSSFLISNINIGSFTLPSNVEYVGEYSFTYAFSFDSEKYTRKIDANLKYIGDYAFTGTYLFTKIPSTVEHIGDYAFTDAYNRYASNTDETPEIVIPEPCTYIGHGAFYNYGSKYYNIVFNNKQKLNMGDLAFGYLSINNITFGDNVPKISSCAFYYCTFKEDCNIYIPSSVSYIGAGAFYNAKGLSNIYINAKSIGTSAFAYVYEIKTLTFGDNVEETGLFSFGYATGESGSRYASDIDTTWGNNIKTIGYASFYYAQIDNPNLPDSITSVEGFGFYHTEIHNSSDENKKQHIPSYLEYAGDHSFSFCFYYGTDDNKITVPSTIKYIGDCAFYDNASPIILEINDTCKHIGKFAFAYSNLQNFAWPSSIDRIPEGCFFYSYLPYRTMLDFKVPDNVTTIGKYAFVDCYFREFDLNKVEVIEDFAFCRTYKLRSNSEVGKFYRENDYSLVLPSTLKEIGKGAFMDCDCISDIQFNSSPTLGENAFALYVPYRTYIEYCPVNRIDYSKNGGTGFCYETSWSFSANSDLRSIVRDLPDAEKYGKCCNFTTSNYEDYYTGSWKDLAYSWDRFPITVRYEAEYDGENVACDTLNYVLKDYGDTLATARYIDEEHNVALEVLTWKDKNNKKFNAKQKYYGSSLYSSRGTALEDLIGTPLEGSENADYIATLYSDTWQTAKFTVTFDTDYGSSVASQTVGYKEKATEPTAPTKTGYDFVEWQLDGETYDFDSLVYNDITLKAIWAPKLYTVTFDSNGGTPVESQQVYYGNPINPYPIPTREGYTFVTWGRYSGSRWDSSVGKYVPAWYDFTETSTVSDNIELIAKWAINSYDVTFHFNDGVTDDVVQSVEYQSTASIEDPTREHYIFDGWYSDEDFENEYSLDTPVTEELDLYAKWTAIKYTVSFETNGGSEVNDITAVYGETVKLPETSKEHYTLNGWYSDADLTNRVADMYFVSGDTTLYAGWDVNSYKIQFIGRNEDGTEVVLYETTAEYNTAISKFSSDLLGEEATNDLADKWLTGDFASWFTDENFTNEYDFDSVIEGNLKIYTPLSYKTYTATFDSNGGTEVADATISYPGYVTEPTAPTKENYTFAGWYVDDETVPDLDGQLFYFETTKVAQDIHLKAHWAKVTHTVKFVTNCDVELNDVVIEHGEALTEPIIENTHYTISGWVLDPDSNEYYDFSQPVNGDITLYAVWNPDSYTITFDSNGGSAVENQTVVYKDKVAQPENPTRTGYTFGGWYTSKDFKTKYDFENEVSEDITLYAKWISNKKDKDKEKDKDKKEETTEQVTTEETSVTTQEAVSIEETTESTTAIENIKTGVEEVDNHVIQISIILIAVIIALAFILIKKGNKPEE